MSHGFPLLSLFQEAGNVCVFMDAGGPRALTPVNVRQALWLQTLKGLKDSRSLPTSNSSARRCYWPQPYGRLLRGRIAAIPQVDGTNHARRIEDPCSQISQPSTIFSGGTLNKDARKLVIFQETRALKKQ